MITCVRPTVFFDKEQTPEAVIASGEVVRFTTLDCFYDQIASEDQDLSKVDFSLGNPCTGPVYIEGAEKGDAVRAEILRIAPRAAGLVKSSGDTGPLCKTAEPRLYILPADGAEFSFKGLPVKTEPMIGTIGCTPETRIATVQTGDFGGNMDCKLVKAGAVLYLPVYVPGALFQLGDVHAVMGDGELCGTGLETGADVDVRLTLIKHADLPLPVLETDASWYVLGHGATYPEALERTTRVMARLLGSACGLDEADAFLYLSLTGDTEINQACAPCDIDMTLRLGVPKYAVKSLL